MARQRIEIDTVMDWLLEHHPELHKTAEQDRNWIWLCCGESLKGDDMAEVRKSIGEFGFRYARNGHPMPSGNVGVWAHSCLVPKRFEHRGKNGGNSRKSQPKQTKSMANSGSGANRRIDPFAVEYRNLAETLPAPAPMDQDLAAGIAFFGS